MFSVNINKLIDMTSAEKQCYADTAEVINKKMSNIILQKDSTQNDNSKFSLGLIGDAVVAFKIASELTKYDKKVLFIDGDISSDIFLGKYKLGKTLEGLTDCIMSKLTGEVLIKQICITNNEKLDIIFSGNVEKTGSTATGIISAGEHYIMEMYKECFEKYDVIVCLSDAYGNLAKYCDATAVIVQEENYNESEEMSYIEKLNNNGCKVLGVIFNE